MWWNHEFNKIYRLAAHNKKRFFNRDYFSVKWFHHSLDWRSQHLHLLMSALKEHNEQYLITSKIAKERSFHRSIKIINKQTCFNKRTIQYECKDFSILLNNWWLPMFIVMNIFRLINDPPILDVSLHKAIIVVWDLHITFDSNDLIRDEYCNLFVDFIVYVKCRPDQSNYSFSG